MIFGRMSVTKQLMDPIDFDIVLYFPPFFLYSLHHYLGVILFFFFPL